jgi:hypothetical protein
LTFPLSELLVTPYLPVPESNGEEWDRLGSTSALDALVELALYGEYNGIDSGKRKKDELELRCAAVAVFEVRRATYMQDILVLNDCVIRTSSERKKSSKRLCRQCSLSKAQV